MEKGKAGKEPTEKATVARTTAEAEITNVEPDATLKEIVTANNSAIVTRKNDSPFLRAFGTTGRQEPSENDAALQMMIRNTMTLWLVLHNIELENKGF
jgi:hypothetical protein